MMLKNQEQEEFLCTITKLFQEKCHYVERWGDGPLFLSKLVSRFLLLNFCVLVKFQSSSFSSFPSGDLACLCMD